MCTDTRLLRPTGVIRNTYTGFNTYMYHIMCIEIRDEGFNLKNACV